MRLTEFRCDGFRSLTNVQIRPAPGINIIRGLNAQGKTSLLEALFFLTTAKSHRTTVEKELVREGSEGFAIRGDVQRSDRAVVLEARWWQGVKRFRVNGVPQVRVSDILGKVNVVMFAPEDILLVKGAAGLRRQFLDMELSRLQPTYLRALQGFRQVLKQRNQLLRDTAADATMLDLWDQQLARHGAVLIEERAKFVEQLDKLARIAYGLIADGETLEIRYQPDVKLASCLLEVVTASRHADLQRRQTCRGPHRDDFEFFVGGRPARSYASQGQQRTAALAMKLADVDLIKDRSGEFPILMLDEVLSELDANRARQLFSTMHKGLQCILTTTNMSYTHPEMGSDSAVFRISGGHVEEEDPNRRQ